MTCQNLQNKLLNITVLFIWYLLQIVGEFKKNVTRQTWQALFHFGEYLFQSTRHFGECLKNMVSHTVMGPGSHVGFPISAKNKNLVYDHTMNISAKFDSNLLCGFRN